MAKSSSTLKGTNKFSCFGKSAERSSRNNTSIYNDLRGMGLLAGLIFSCFGNGVERISCAGRGCKPRPAQGVANSVRHNSATFNVTDGVANPVRHRHNSATFNVTDGVANPVRHSYGRGCKPRPAQTPRRLTLRTGLQTPSGTGQSEPRNTLILGMIFFLLGKIHGN
jgi:hypothetical protein